MAKTKTRPTAGSVAEYIGGRASAGQAADCRVLTAMMTRVTGERPRMWGPSIVGFGRYAYRYESGHGGEACLTGFAIRGRELVVYLVAESAQQTALRARLGKHRMGKSCLYLRQLADVDSAILERLISGSVAEVKRRHPTTRA